MSFAFRKNARNSRAFTLLGTKTCWTSSAKQRPSRLSFSRTWRNCSPEYTRSSSTRTIGASRPCRHWRANVCHCARLSQSTVTSRCGSTTWWTLPVRRCAPCSVNASPSDAVATTSTCHATHRRCSAWLKRSSSARPVNGSSRLVAWICCLPTTRSNWPPTRRRVNKTSPTTVWHF